MLLCSGTLGSEMLPQVKELKYLLFTSEGKVKCKVERVACCGSSTYSSTTRPLWCNIYLHLNPYLWLQALCVGRKTSKISLHCRFCGLSLRDRVIRHLQLAWSRCSIASRRSQLRWCRHLVRIPPGCLPLEMFQAYPTCWKRKSSLEVPQEELECLAKETLLGNFRLRSDWQ